ncbi:MAG: hypothetical protein C5B59_16630 [Bacteroidetes bacterium]|nr:MAG: hypothetical protein C5B59_16630 [Bacteroidota bacterium]
MNEENFNNLKAFVIKESSVDDEEITRETKIEDDLGVYGDDAIEFMIRYGKQFNVDLSHFMASDYFSKEGDIILPAVIRFFKGKSLTPRKALTVGHLEKGILAGRLDDEIISG